MVVPVVTKLFPPERPAAEWNDLKLAELQRALRAQLMLRGAAGQWDFFHAPARAAVKRRNLTDDGLVKSIHSALADHLELLSREDPLHQSETMFHLMGADEARQAARYYGGELTAGEAGSATRVLAAHVLTGEAQEVNPALAWLASLPDQTQQDHLTVANLCNRFQFVLHDAIESQSRLPTRLALHATTRASIEPLAAADPSNAGWQRDLSVSYYKIADALEKSGDPSAIQFWRRAYEVLSGVKRKGLFISPQDERVLEQLRQKVGSTLHRPTISVDIPTPHPDAESERAARLSIQYQEELARWKALPWWKRLTVKKPEPPT